MRASPDSFSRTRLYRYADMVLPRAASRTRASRPKAMINQRGGAPHRPVTVQGRLAARCRLGLRVRLAQYHAHEAQDLEVATGFLGGLLRLLLDRDVRVLNERLLEKAELLVELVEAPLGDLLLDGFGFAALRSLGAVDDHFVLDDVCRDLFSTYRDGCSRRDLHGN